MLKIYGVNGMNRIAIKMRSLVWLLTLLTMVSLLAGCVTTETTNKPAKPVFFPPAPQLPRFQFLRGFSGPNDFKKKKSGLDAFLSGASQNPMAKFKKPYGVNMSHGVIYVADTVTTVWKMDLVHNAFSSLQGDRGMGKIVQPINIAIDDQGNKYVADVLRGAVVKYDKHDMYVKAYSIPGSWRPVDAEVYGDKLYVADSTHDKGGVRVFDIKSGELVDTIGMSGPPEQRLRIVANIAFDKDGYLYATDVGRFQIVKYDRDGHYRGALGEVGSSPGHFGRPRGLAIDRDGRIYAVDAAFDVVQIFSPNGQMLGVLGGPGTSPGTLTLPAGICINYDDVDLFKDYIAPGFNVEYLVLVTSQFHDTNCVSVYGFGKMEGKKYPSDLKLVDEVKEELRKKESR